MRRDCIPSCVKVMQRDGRYRFCFEDLCTDFLDSDDEFIARISRDNLNPDFLKKHLRKEFEVRNLIDEAVGAADAEMFDEVLFYDPYYVTALYEKSRVLKSEGHFIRALRTYRKALRHGLVADDDYLKDLQMRAIDERDSLPPIKRAIFNGDHAFQNGDYDSSLEFYDSALESSDAFRERILAKLLNKKGWALLKLDKISEALECFDEAICVSGSDNAYFGRGYCLYKLSLNNSSSCKTCLDRIYVKSIADAFKMAKKISKRQLLIKADIMAELDCREDALRYYDEFLDCHFVKDDDYRHALKGREACL